MNSHPPTILILDEDDEMRGLMTSQIRSSEYTFLQAGKFTEALEHLQKSAVSLFILNFKVPEISLGDLLKRARFLAPIGTLSILVLTNPGLVFEQERAKAAGADDFLERPFQGGDLTAKVRALLKKSHPNLDRASEKAGRLSFQDLVMDIHSHDVFSQGTRVKLTPNEFKLLQALLERPGEILSRDRLIELVQGEGVAVIDRAVDTHVFTLRKKLGEPGDAIETIRGEGYRMGVSAPMA